MDYPDKLLKLFDDPLLAEVRPLPKAIASDDRLVEKLLAINDYIRTTAKIPSDKGTFEERRLYRSLKALQAYRDIDMLRELDEYHLFDSE